jgi:hypothetical protein
MQKFTFVESYGRHTYTLTIKLLTKFDPTKHFPEGWVGQINGENLYYSRTDETIAENMETLFHTYRGRWISLPKPKRVTKAEEVIIATFLSKQLRSAMYADQKWLNSIKDERAGGNALNIFRKF